MKRKISIFINVSAFNLTLHKVNIILDNEFIFYMDKLNTGERTVLDSDNFKNDKGHDFPFYKRPKSIEIRGKEGTIKLGVSDIAYEE